MNPFQYPIDTKVLLRKKRKIKDELLARPCDWLEKRVAILGGSTTNEVADQLELFLLHYGIRPIIYQSAFGQYWQDAVFGTETLDRFQPDIVYIHTNWRNIECFPTIHDPPEIVGELLAAEYERFSSMWQALAEKFSCPVIQNNFDRPACRLLGNRDIWDERGKSGYIARLNQKFYEYARKHRDFYINDLDYLSADYGLSRWGNALYWHMYKYALSLDAVPFLAQSVANIIKSIYGKNKKALVLDLDNTLWGGTIGDDGVEGIAIGRELPQGQVYADFQDYCKALTQIGVVLAVDSKNDEKNALAGLNHPDGMIRPDDFVAIKANWNAKDQNLREIAEELSLGTDSIVFVDDNPAERELISAQMPEVSVPAMRQPETFIQTLDHSGYFEVTALSGEDMDKTRLYHARGEARKSAAAFQDYGDYLDSLEMSASLDDFKPLYVQRIAQLTNKSNQFNLTTLRCSEDEIQSMQNNPNYICLCGQLTDRFANHGIVAIAAGEKRGTELHIRLWLMSCRVLKRGMEDAMMNALIRQASACGITTVFGYYYPTKKNGMVRKFYDEMGFDLQSEDGENGSVWKMSTAAYKERTVHMTVSLQEAQAANRGINL